MFTLLCFHVKTLHSLAMLSPAIHTTPELRNFGNTAGLFLIRQLWDCIAVWAGKHFWKLSRRWPQPQLAEQD